MPINSSFSGRPFTPFARPDYQIKRTKITVAPAIFPVTLADVKTWLGITDTNSDDIINSLIESQTEIVEQHLRKALITRTYELTLDQWFTGEVPIFEGSRVGSVNATSGSGELSLYWPPLQTVESINTISEDGTPTLYDASNYYVDISSDDQWGRVIQQEGAQTPTNLRRAASVIVEYKAGYGDTAADVPFAIRQAITMAIAWQFNHRGDCGTTADGLNSNGAVVDPLEVSGAAGLLNPYKILRL